MEVKTNSPKSLPLMEIANLSLEKIPDDPPFTMIPKLQAKTFNNGPNSFGFDSGFEYLEHGWPWAQEQPFAVLLESTIDDGSCLFHSIMKECGSLHNLTDRKVEFANDKEFLKSVRERGILDLDYNNVDDMNAQFKMNNTYLNRNLYIRELRKILTEWLQRPAINPYTEKEYNTQEATQHINTNPEILKIIIKDYIRDPHRVVLSQQREQINALTNRALFDEFDYTQMGNYFINKEQNLDVVRAYIRSKMREYILKYCANNDDEKLMEAVLSKPGFLFTELIISPEKVESILDIIFRNDPLGLAAKFFEVLNGRGLAFMTPRMLTNAQNPMVRTTPLFRELLNNIYKGEVPPSEEILNYVSNVYAYITDDASPTKLKLRYLNNSVNFNATSSTVFVDIINAFNNGATRVELYSELAMIIFDKETAVYKNITRYIDEIQRIRTLFTNTIIDIINGNPSMKYANLKSAMIDTISHSGNSLKEILTNYYHRNTNKYITSEQIDELLNKDPRTFISEGNSLIPLFNSSGNLIAPTDTRSLKVRININFFVLGRGRVLINQVRDTNYTYIMENLPRWVIWAGEDFIRLLNEMFSLRIIVTNGYVDFISIYGDYKPSPSSVSQREEEAVVFVNYVSGVKGNHYQTLRSVTVDPTTKERITQSVFKSSDYWPRMADLYNQNLASAQYSAEDYHNSHRNIPKTFHPEVIIDTRISNIVNSPIFQDPATMDVQNLSFPTKTGELPSPPQPLRIVLPTPVQLNQSPPPPRLAEFIRTYNLQGTDIQDVIAMYESIYGQKP